MSQPSIDAMLGILNNANQTATIIDTQRTIADNLRASAERNNNNLLSSMMNENQKTDNLINMHNAFANQNLATLGASLKDMINNTSSAQLTSTERNGAAGINATDRVGSIISHSLERIGGDNINATERVGSLINHSLERIGSDNIHATERNGSANLLATEKVGSILGNLLNQNNNLLNSSIKDNSLTSERNFGESRLFNATQNQNLERRIGDYYLQAERNFHGLNNDLLRVENSLGRLADNHHNSSMIELLKVHASLDKSNDRIELNLTKQAAENYANVQIEAAKNKMALETKMLELGNNIKETILRDNNDTRNLINNFNNDNLRYDLNAEKIIHALHHHHPHHHHGHHYDDYHHRHHPHHHYYPFFFGNGNGGGGGGGGGGSPRGRN